MPVTVHHNKREEAYEFLQKQKVGVLATVDPNGDPHAAAIYFAVDKTLSVLFVTKTGTKKADNLEHNNHAMLVVYDSPTQTTVQLTGMVTKITDFVETNEIFTKIIYASIEASGIDVPPVAKLDNGEYVAYKLKPTQIRMAIFTRPESGNYQGLFKTIVP